MLPSGSSDVTVTVRLPEPLPDTELKVMAAGVGGGRHDRYGDRACQRDHAEGGIEPASAPGRGALPGGPQRPTSKTAAEHRGLRDTIREQ